jgi:hypothetical protein
MDGHTGTYVASNWPVPEWRINNKLPRSPPDVRSSGWQLRQPRPWREMWIAPAFLRLNAIKFRQSEIRYQQLHHWSIRTINYYPGYRNYKNKKKKKNKIETITCIARLCFFSKNLEVQSAATYSKLHDICTSHNQTNSSLIPKYTIRQLIIQ